MSRELTMEALEILIDELDDRLTEMIKEHNRLDKPEEPKPVSLNELWNRIPGEYKYIAKDRVGSWYCYSGCPILNETLEQWTGLLQKYTVQILTNEESKLANEILGDLSWEDSLIVRPCSEHCDIYRFQVGNDIYKFWLERPFPDRLSLYCQRNFGEHRKIAEIDTLVEGSLFFGANGIRTRIN